MMNVLSPQKQESLINSIKAGLSLRTIAAREGVDRKTARRYFEKMPPPICPCGRQLPHQGSCGFRISISPNRRPICNTEISIGFERDGDKSKVVAISPPEQEETSVTLFSAIELLNPNIRTMVHAIIAGDDLEVAAAEAGIGVEQLPKLLPRLKTFLAPYVKSGVWG